MAKRNEESFPRSDEVAKKSSRTPEQVEAGRQAWKEQRTRAREEQIRGAENASGEGSQSNRGRDWDTLLRDLKEETEPALDNNVFPANVGDQPTAHDTLGFKPYVDAIAEFLTHEVTQPPLTLSIEGEWGSGKSSFMLQLEKQLHGANFSVVRFNAWRYDKDDAMWAAFALEFARKLAKQLKWPQRWWAHARLFVRRFRWERGWRDLLKLAFITGLLLAILALPILFRDKIITLVLPPPPQPTTVAVPKPNEPEESEVNKLLRKTAGAGGVLAYLALVFGLALKLKPFPSNPLTVNLKQHLDTPDYESRVAFIDRFHDDFARVVDVYGRKKKVFVFIDDLDRCEVPKAADLMQALNLMISDSSRLIFILGMDREKVAAGLAVKYEKLLPYLAPASDPNTKSFDPVLGLEYGYGFIEKFIQLPFLVPQATKDQVGDFFSELSANGKATISVVAEPSQSGKKAEDVVTENSEMMRNILEMVAPTFDYNPRRLKQFINAFRLKTFIASRTNLFEKPSDKRYDQLTVDQLGKFVAIALRWPLLLADLDNHRSLFVYLEKMVFEDMPAVKVLKENDPSLAQTLERWRSRPALRALLRFGCETNEQIDDSKRARYGLSRINIDRLLQISPRVAAILKQQQKTSRQPDTTNTGPKIGVMS